MTDVLHTDEATRDGGARPTEHDLQPFRRELTGYCYRMLGSAFDADDAVQETMVRAWKALDRFEGRSSLRSWLYRIATNVCLDSIDARGRRALPMDMSPDPSAPVVESLGAPSPEGTWVEPAPTAMLQPAGDPAEVAVAREGIRLAFVAALQTLPPKQRAVLVLREVLRWHADEVAELLETTVASVNSALQRARATLADRDLGDEAVRVDEMSDEQRALLQRYVSAFERYDMDALVSVLRQDATMSMPPYALWLAGVDDIVAWHVGPGHGCRGSRTQLLQANGLPAMATWKPKPGGGWQPWSLVVVELAGERIFRTTHYLDVERLFPLFGLPLDLDAAR